MKNVMKIENNIEEPFYDVKMDQFGNVYYYNKDGELHNLNGPAVEYFDGYKAYYVNGLRHRLDGPARIFSDGNIEYYVNGKYLLKEEFDRLTKNYND